MSTNIPKSPDIHAKLSDTYKDIQVSGRVIAPSYEGFRITVYTDAPNLVDVLSANVPKPEKLTIDRHIECTLNMTPQTLKEWAIAFSQELKKYEGMFGTILSPEEIQQKIRDASQDKSNS